MLDILEKKRKKKVTTHQRKGYVSKIHLQKTTVSKISNKECDFVPNNNNYDYKT